MSFAMEAESKMTVESDPGAAELLAPDEPVAVIGMYCRFPGAPNPNALWRLLLGGEEAVADVAPQRWQTGNVWAGERPLRAGHLDGIEGFDAEFFGISPREAIAMDPQQRLMVELSWEALEDARIIPTQLQGRSVGVFVGAMEDDYAKLVNHYGAGAVTQQTLTGVHRSIIANRVSYLLGLQGPSLVIDSAQSSSLVAVHLAVESLRRGESSLAIAGGVHLNILPETFLMADRLGGLSPDGRCYTFDARANGYARGEGGGVVVLKPLRQALRDGDRVHCVIRGSAVNNGGAGDHLMAPRQEGQEAVLCRAYQRAGVDPAEVRFVELHGTGTPTGDPVEAAALGAVLGSRHSPDVPLLVGSVKTNIGHLEGAAGIAGLIKAILCVRERTLAPSLNFQTPNPSIPLDLLNLRVNEVALPLVDTGRPLVAGVSSFGMGGTNAHVVLEQAPVVADEVRAVGSGGSVGPIPVVASAHGPVALRAQAARLLGLLEGGTAPELVDVGWSSVTTRSAFAHRAVVLAGDGDELRAGLAALARGGSAADVITGVAGELEVRPVFVFPGQGTQWAGMGVALLGSSSVFAERMGECARALAPFVDWSLVDALGDGALLARVDVSQPVLWAVMVSLAALWRSYGVEPSAVVGHSQGEIAAACVAGALSLEDGARIVALRSRLLASLPGGGAMVSVALPVEQVAQRLAGFGERVGIAAVNGPNSVVVSGDAEGCEQLVVACDTDGIRARRILAAQAGHSPRVDALRDPLLEGLAPITPRSSTVPFYSTVIGDRLETTTLDADYWWANLRQPVRFQQATTALLTQGHRVLIETSPHPVLSVGIGETAEQAGTDAVVIATLRRDNGHLLDFYASAATAWVNGLPVTWTAAYTNTNPHRIDLPTYPFQRHRYWLDTPTLDQDTGEPERRLARLPGTERDRALAMLVGTEVAAVLGRSAPNAIDPARAFKDLGFDSPMAVDLRNRLRAATGLRLPTTVVYDHPTPKALVAYLRTELLAESDADAGTASGAGPTEAELRQVLASIPLERLRAAGLLDTLTALAIAPTRLSPSDGLAGTDRIDALDTESLVRMALGTTSS